jgi:hypothetical protein
MENLLELLRKYNMTNADVLSTSGSPLATTNLSDNEMNIGVSQGMGLDNESLLGSDKQTNKTLSLMGLLSSPEALTGLGLISAGMKGQGIGEAALPSFVQGLNVSSTVRAMTKEQEQQKAIDEFAGKVPEQYKPLFKAFPKETMKLLLTPKTPTISGEALKVAGKLQGLNTTEFKEAFKKLSKVEQDLYNKEIIGNQDLTSMFLKEALEGGNLGNYAQKQKAMTATKEEPVAVDIKSTDVFKKYKEANPNVSDEALIDAIKKKYPNK